MNVGTSVTRGNLELRTNLKNSLPAFACALVPILGYLLIRPYAEIGIVDDWSYIKTAQVLAQTGHIVYNGWGSPMLGWHAYLGAFLIKLFGFSFTAARFGTLIEAVVTAFLLQRVGERIGLTPRNAALATIAFVLSPLCLPLACTFMTDLAGVLCIVLCLYMCLRALDAESEQTAMVWISLAALVNAADGTARQIAWLGVLVMVPCTVWLLREKQRVLLAGGISCIAGAGIVLASTRWLARQPYIVPAPLLNGGGMDLLKNFGRVILGGVGVLTLFALPLLVFFAGSLRSWRRPAAVFAALLVIAPIHFLRLDRWPAGAAYDAITHSTFARLNAIAAHGLRLTAARHSLQILLAATMVFGLLSLVLCIFEPWQQTPVLQPAARATSWQNLGVILVPFGAAYILLLAGQFVLFDRYFLPLLAILVLALTRFYQERVRVNLPFASLLPIFVFGAFSIAATHDDFALYRGYANAIGKLRSSGTPATSILGPWEYGAWTEVTSAGHVNDRQIQTPKGAYVPQPWRVLPAACTFGFFGALEGMPSIHPVYAVSANPQDCAGQSAQPLVTYRTWVAPRNHTIYAVKLPASFPR